MAKQKRLLNKNADLKILASPIEAYCVHKDFKEMIYIHPFEVPTKSSNHMDVRNVYSTCNALIQNRLTLLKWVL